MMMTGRPGTGRLRGDLDELGSVPAAAPDEERYCGTSSPTRSSIAVGSVVHPPPFKPTSRTVAAP